MISRTVLIACLAFERLSAPRVGSAIGRGLHTGGWEPDICPIVHEGRPAADLRALLEELDFDTRMRRARALVLSERCLQLPPAAGAVSFELASRARQSGVPAYAVTDENGLDAFAARMLDLQLIIEAASRPALHAAGRRLAGLI